MSDLVSLTQQGDVAVITINNPPVNALSPGVPEGILAFVQAAQKTRRSPQSCSSAVVARSSPEPTSRSSAKSLPDRRIAASA